MAALHRAVQDGTLELLYQPEIELATGTIVAMEALLRWHHPELGTLTPAEFLPLAEDAADRANLGRWVLASAAAEAASWRGLPGPPRRLWINVSTTELASPDFATEVADVLTAHRLPVGMLGFDVSEESVVTLGDQGVSALAALRNAGAALAIDDSSSWIATLGAIHDLPVDAVKLGHRFVRSLTGPDRRGPGRPAASSPAADRRAADPPASSAAFDHASSVRAVITAAHAMGIEVVAEGVESEVECRWLTQLGCDRAHGFWFASPMPAELARELMREGTVWPVSASL